MQTNKSLSKYLRPVSNNKKKQIIWIKDYLIRRKNKKEYFFIFCLKNKRRFGLARVIHLDRKTFHFGGWVLEKKLKPSIAFETCLSIFEFAFNKLDYKRAKLWVDLRNKKVINFHKNLGATFLKKTKKEVFLNFNKKNYKILKNKFKYFFYPK